MKEENPEQPMFFIKQFPVDRKERRLCDKEFSKMERHIRDFLFKFSEKLIEDDTDVSYEDMFEAEKEKYLDFADKLERMIKPKFAVINRRFFAYTFAPPTEEEVE